MNRHFNYITLYRINKNFDSFLLYFISHWPAELKIEIINSSIKELSQFTSIDPNDMVAVFGYGSRVYGCDSEVSDYDYIIVRNGGNRVEYNNAGRRLSVNIIPLADFQNDLIEHEISALECLWLPKNKILKAHSFPFTYNPQKLRHSISEKASHSFVKAKKKMAVGSKDYNEYVGKKSLFHSLRIIDFGIQIGIHGKIVNYSSANHLWEEIVNSPTKDWNYYHDKYKPIHNKMMSDFRILCLK